MRLRLSQPVGHVLSRRVEQGGQEVSRGSCRRKKVSLRPYKEIVRKNNVKRCEMQTSVVSLEFQQRISLSSLRSPGPESDGPSVINQDRGRLIWFRVHSTIAMIQR